MNPPSLNHIWRCCGRASQSLVALVVTVKYSFLVVKSRADRCHSLAFVASVCCLPAPPKKGRQQSTNRPPGRSPMIGQWTPLPSDLLCKGVEPGTTDRWGKNQCNAGKKGRLFMRARTEGTTRATLFCLSPFCKLATDDAFLL